MAAQTTAKLKTKEKSSPSKGKAGIKWGPTAALKPTDVVSLVLDVPTAKTLLHALSVAIAGGSTGGKGKGKGKGGK
jgi:hypothetical protein